MVKHSKEKNRQSKGEGEDQKAGHLTGKDSAKVLKDAPSPPPRRPAVLCCVLISWSQSLPLTRRDSLSGALLLTRPVRGGDEEAAD